MRLVGIGSAGVICHVFILNYCFAACLFSRLARTLTARQTSAPEVIFRDQSVPCLKIARPGLRVEPESASHWVITVAALTKIAPEDKHATWRLAHVPSQTVAPTTTTASPIDTASSVRAGAHAPMHKTARKALNVRRAVAAARSPAARMTSNAQLARRAWAANAWNAPNATMITRVQAPSCVAPTDASKRHLVGAMTAVSMVESATTRAV